LEEEGNVKEEKRRNNKEMNKKIFASIFVIGMLALAMGAGTYSYFSSTKTSTGNTFTAGILDMTPVTFGPVAFTNWKPGDTGQIVIALKNTGNIDIKYLVMRDENYVESPPGGVDLGNVIEILSIEEYKIYPDGVSVAYGPETCSGATYEGWLGTNANGDGHLSLKEFFAGFPPGTTHANNLWDVVTLSANWGGGVLEVGYTYKMVLNMKFMETGHPQDEYQSSSISFDWVVMGTHADKTEIEGYIP
jgi:predicted ribosomally synthesized peptide with SipW-like signal peptide